MLSSSQDKVKELDKKEELQLIVRKEEHVMISSSPIEVEQDNKAHQDETFTTCTVTPTSKDKLGMVALRTIPVYPRNGDRK